MKPFSIHPWIVPALVLTTLWVRPAASQDGALDVSPLDGLTWRSIGPAIMGGRVTDVAGVPGDANTFYVGTAAGGVFRTVNGGTTFEPIFDEIGIPSIGALAVAPSDHNVVYVGTGEGNPRNSASVGRGIFRSVDAGATWTFLGLEETEKFTRIRVHPTNPDVVYAAALGHEWGANAERGVYRSADGGATWDQILFVDSSTGAADLAMDPDNPRILYAAMYDFLRQPWYFRSGGTGSGLYRSADGGDTWTNLSAAAPDNGLPEGVLGRMGVAVAPSDANVVYAMIETAVEGELWRSDDRGITWSMISADGAVNSRPFYFTDLRVDPTTSERVYALSGRLQVSTDGGRTWEQLGDDIHPDHHAMWIDPENPRRIINGNDGGVYLSYDRGATFQYLNRIALGQFYQIGADMRDPYYVCGGLQDNGVWCGPSETKQTVGLVNDNWYIIHFGDGYYAQIDPTDWTSIFTNAHYGNIVRVDAHSFERQSIQPYPVSLRGAAAGDHPFRFNWNSPIHMSPHDPKVVYFGSNVLFRTEDGGRSWSQISPDLTTNDPEKQRPSGGPITTDNTSAEYHTTIVTIAESPVAAGVIWVGTDDGYVQVTTDGGERWTNVTSNVPNLPGDSWVSRVEASHVDANTAYATFDRHRLDDMRPYVYKTSDGGRTWQDIAGDLPEFGYLHVVREDPKNSSVVYVGSEFGLFVSFSGGGDWTALSGGSLPYAPVNDLLVHPRDNDLIAGTHGRAIWILDDVTPLQQLADAMQTDAYLFDPPQATRFQYHFTKPFLAQAAFKGENPGSVATISYYLRDEADELPTVTIESEAGEVVRTLEGTGRAGVNRIAWELDYQPLDDAAGGFAFARTTPTLRVPPGVYTVRLAAAGEEMTKLLQIRLDPAVRVSEADLIAQIETVRRLTAMRYDADGAIDDVVGVKGQLDPLIERLEGGDGDAASIAEDARSVDQQLEELRLELVSEPGGYRSPAMLRDRIAAMLGSVGSVNDRPTSQQLEWVGRFDEQLQDVRRRLDQIILTGVSDLNRRIQEAGLPAIEVPKRGDRLTSDDAAASLR
jgi:photosystem II stability/assembly factor-like uncharacterized protein